jgi:RHS repeat-associated protein
VSFTYDTVYGKLKTMSDGSGLTTYDYHPNDGRTLGAGLLKSIDSPMENDLIEFGYDAQGRLKTRRINGAANTTTIVDSDDLGRVVSLTNPLGTFEHTYDPVNLLPKTVTAPNGLVTTFDYHTAAADLRLKEIQHTLAGGQALSKHGYTYSPAGNIKSWEQATRTTPTQTWGIVYDKADQLEAATLASTTPSVLAQHAWRYDKAGNRISRQQGPQITQTGYNFLNQVTSEQPGGWMRVGGTTDEPAKVRVKSNANAFIPAATSGTGGFSAWVQAVAGNNTLTIEAEDFSPQANRRTGTYRVQVNGTNRVPGYDFNGNLIDNGSGQTYEWDAENRLVKITYADQTSTEFRYDGQSRRVGITEKDAARVVTSEKRYLWAEGAQPAEERAADGRTVVKQYHAQGEFLPGAAAPLNKVFYTKDHLGSVRELVNGNGTLQTRYDYDLWGGRTKITGMMESEVGYTGHHHHGKSGLVLTWYRAYDPVTGRWLSRDPIGENGGINLYGYVGNEPVNFFDEYGLDRSVMLGGPLLLHMWIRVDVYDECGNVIGQKDLHFTPVEGFSTMDPEFHPGPAWTLERIKSDRSADERLSNTWDDMANDPNAPHWNPGGNCWVASQAGKNIGK